MDPAVLFKLLTELSLWFATAGLFLSSFASVPVYVGPALAVAGLVSSCVPEKKRALRILPSLAAAVALSVLFIDSFASALLILPPAVYVVMLAVTGRYVPDRGEFIDFFRIAGLVLPIVIVGAALLGAKEAVLSSGLPNTLVFLLGGVMLSRLLRHDESTRRRPRFILLGVGAPLLACALALLLSRPGILSAAGKLLSLFYDYVVSPILMLIAYAMFGLLWLIQALIKVFVVQKEYEPAELDIDFGDISNQFGEAEEYAGNGNAFESVLIALAVVAFILAAFFLFKKLMSSRRSNTVSQSETRERLTIETERPKLASLLRPKTPAEHIRSIYARFLRKAESLGAVIKDGDTTDVISDKTSGIFDRESIDSLREIYIEARYSGHTMTRANVAAARDAWSSLKKSAGRNAQRV